MDKPTLTTAVWKAAKRVLQYVKNPKQLSLTFKKNENESCLLAYADADWGFDKLDRKSVSGLAVYHCKNIISWGSKIQQIIALSPAEAEYVASATCVAEIIYLQGLAKT